jgi:hypothetical protein
VLIALTAYMYSLVIMATIVSQFASNRKLRKIAGFVASTPGKEERPARKNA